MNASTVSCGCAVTAVTRNTWWPSVAIWSWRLSGVGDDDPFVYGALGELYSEYFLASRLDDESVIDLKHSTNEVWG